ncbi:hypothetical protein PUV54_07145 [Hyphococcus flavus]|uniref:Uncharacterized protein n=1 Tax=Hyphococcus flavus TaxID=1866326 RepID=A0AAE9ZHL5_9PROT|nr:hypothetical protein [Hyphococcus flavus]WDI32972.1 hypothetical protein PUV54_07145 [Hyphococcus flavus]
MVIVAHWTLANVLYYFFKNGAVNYIAPFIIIFLALFYTFSKSKTLNGAFIHRVFFGYYSLYFLINLWHLLGRFLFPETLLANYWFSLAASNIVFILIVLTMWGLAILKFLDNHSDGGLMGVYKRNIHHWRKWFGGK